MTHLLLPTILFICDRYLLSVELLKSSSYSENCLYVQWISIKRFQGLKDVSILLFIAGCGKWMWLDLWDTTPGPLGVCWTYYHPQDWYMLPILKHLCPEYEMDLPVRLKSKQSIWEWFSDQSINQYLFLDHTHTCYWICWRSIIVNNPWTWTVVGKPIFMTHQTFYQ